MKIIILTAIVIMAVRGQMMYSSLLPSQYQKSSSLLGTYPANYPLKFIPYPTNYPQTFHPNYPMNMHQYPSMHLAQVPQTQDFPLTNYPLNIQQHPLQGSQITVQTPQTQDAPVIEKAKIPKMHQIQHRFQRLLDRLKRTGRKDCLRSIWANGPGCVLEQLKAESPMAIEKDTMEMKEPTIKNIFRIADRIITLLNGLPYNEELNYKEIIDINVPKIISIFKKEFNLDLTDFQAKSFLLFDEEGNHRTLELPLEVLTLTTFLYVDNDENGELSLQELPTIRKSLMEEESGQKIMTRGVAMIDLDRDNKLSLAECQEFLHKVFKIINEESPLGFVTRLLFLLSDTDKNDKLSLLELSTMVQFLYEIFQTSLVEEESEKMVEDKVHKIISRKSVRDAFTSFWFLFADNDENDELSLQEVSSAKDIFVEDEGLKMRQMVEMMMMRMAVADEL